MTKQRECVLRAIRENAGHHTAEEIFEYAKKECPGIAIATVYNNLNVLVENRIIKRISRVGKPDVYDRSMLPHEHLICITCGKIVDLDLPGIKSVLSDELDREIGGYDLIIHAECDFCRKNKKQPV